MAVKVAAVVPAAGRSERFGRMKLVEGIRGEPLLNHTVRALLDSGVAPVVVVVSPAARLEAVPLLAHADVRVVVNPDPSRGMFSSIQSGLADVGDLPALVLPADMPFVHRSTVAEVAAALVAGDGVVVAAHEGRRGHPVGLPARLTGALVKMDPTTSLKAALLTLGEDMRLLEVGDEGVVRDVDRPEDLDPAR
jgi:molybdenum cofactor cytidylyltransferase